MKLESIGDVIAERIFWLSDSTGSKSKVIVSVGKPKPFPDSGDFFCPYQIVGIGDERIRYAGGVDSMQAIQLVLLIIKADLNAIINDNHKLFWEPGEDDADLGFHGPG